jgi:lysozyme
MSIFPQFDYSSPRWFEKLKFYLKKHEGLRLKPYTDTAGKITIGIGRNLSDNGITLEEAELFLQRDACDAVLSARLIFGDRFDQLSDPRKVVISDMIFNLGVTRFQQFTKLIRAVSVGDYPTAANEMLGSLWAKQVGERAKELASMMRTGEWS